MSLTNQLDPLAFPVILAGGGGTRLWPLSRPGRPKQFLRFDGSDTLFQATVRRMSGFSDPDNVRVVCGLDHQSRIEAELTALDMNATAAVLSEPTGRNTGPAVLFAAKKLMERHEDAVLIILPADHAIGDEVAFREALSAAIEPARAGFIVTLGIEPSAPETGYGYIQAGEAIGMRSVRRVVRFEEKPDRLTAERFLASGQHFWNAGIFIAKASVLIEEFANFQPEMTRAIHRFLQGDQAAYAQAPKLSIDYAIMEHTQKAAVIPASFGWTDLGNWQAVDALAGKDENGNHAEGKVLLRDCRDTYVKSEGRKVAAIGLEGVAVISTEDAVLVTEKSRAQDVKHIVDDLDSKSSEALSEDRPWGSFTILGQSDNFKTKRLDVLPGKRTSLQRHKHRTEHWVVASGTAKVTIDDRVELLNHGETTLIPAGAIHRLENPGPAPLTVIEVQLGDYFGEDDIERFEDDYGRVQGAFDETEASN